jgi:hypothetical protein
VSVSSGPTIHLGGRFAGELPELALAWQAEQAPAPRLLALNEPLAVQLGLDPAWLRTDDGLRLLLGNRLPAGATPVAQAYAGHQFGGFVPRLGDGRALLLGELVDGDGRLRDLHLKGSGRTPFARGGDGLAAIGPMLREHVVSEAMHALGIPTTRLARRRRDGRQVRRETMLPRRGPGAGREQPPCASAASSTPAPRRRRRAAPARRPRHRAAHPEAASAGAPVRRAVRGGRSGLQAHLVAQWMLVGFVHGVRNTDNTTISGETIDYGPCAFLDAFDPATCSAPSTRAGATPTATSPSSRSGTSPGSPRRCCRCSRRGGAGGRDRHGLARALRPGVRRGLDDRHAREARALGRDPRRGPGAARR